MTSASRRMEIVVNIAIVVAVVAILGEIGWHYLPRLSAKPEPLAPGTKLNVADYDWTATDKTIVLFLQKGCVYCNQSGAFYQQLTQRLADRKDVRMMAVLPGPIDESRAYLSGLGVFVNETKQGSLKQAGVAGTPTLALVNNLGSATDVWRGKLTPAQERQVFERLGVSIDDDSRAIDDNELRTLRSSDSRLVIVDVRDRAEYARGHVDGARNIPVDELAVRLENELAPDDLIVTCAGPETEEVKDTVDTTLDDRGFRHLWLKYEPQQSLRP